MSDAGITRTRRTRGTGTEERDGRDNLCERSATPGSRRKIPQKSSKNNLSQEAAGGASASLAQTVRARSAAERVWEVAAGDRGP